MNIPANSSMPTTPPSPVIVVGGGWAGLAAAVELSRHGHPVTLLESAKQLGGRARRVPFGERRVDNGQHLMLGAYHAILSLLHTLGLTEESVLARRPLHLALRSPGGDTLSLQAPAFLPAPLHLSWGLLRANGLSWKERISALRLCLRLLASGFQVSQDQPLADFLQHHRQPPRLIRLLWEPLCLATLNTSLQQASTEVFLRVLQDAFVHRRHDADLLFSLTDLGSTIPDPALDYIEGQGGSVQLSQRVSKLLLKGEQIQGVETADGNQLEAPHVVLATPPHNSQRLLAPHPPLHEIAQQLLRFHYSPICTVYLQYPPDTMLENDMEGMVETHGQWVIDRKLNNQPGLMAVVISADGPHMAQDNATLAQTVTEELANLHPHWPAPLEQLVIREKRATFHCEPNINQWRPGVETPVTGLWLAGDYVNTGYPATLEGAVRSGLQCAHRITHGEPR